MTWVLYLAPEDCQHWDTPGSHCQGSPYYTGGRTLVIWILPLICFIIVTCWSPVHTVAPAPLALLPVVAPVLGAGRLLAPASGHGLHHGALTVHVGVQASVAGQRFPFSDIGYDMTNLSFIDGTTCLSSSPLSRHCCSSAPCHSIHPYCSGAICKQGVKGSHFKIIYFVLLFCWDVLLSMVFVFSYQFSMNKIQLTHFLVSNARLEKTQYGFHTHLSLTCLASQGL